MELKSLNCKKSFERAVPFHQNGESESSKKYSDGKKIQNPRGERSAASASTERPGATGESHQVKFNS